MPRRKNQFTAGHFYHIYNRGAGREKIFYNDDNYQYCLRLIKKYLTQHELSIIAYCLMPNHYHFLIRQNGELPLSRFMGLVFNAYVQAVNTQQKRQGTLFEKRFKDVHVDKEEYLVHLCRYIHANPVKAGLVAQPEGWPYSNYQEWIRVRPGTLVDHAFIDTYFPHRSQYAEFVLDYAHGRDNLPRDIKNYLFP